MEKELVGKRPHFRPVKSGSNIYRAMLLLGLILAGLWLLLAVQRGQVKPLFQPTPTPTRIANSYILEAQAYFEAGKLYDPDPPKPTPPNPDAIDAYQKALEIDPGNAKTWAEMARIQTYAINMLSSDAERKAKLDEALQSINKAIELNPDDSTSHAVRAFVLDWNASYASDATEAANLLKEAEGEAVRAYQLDPQNALALAFYAEVLLDQQKWVQAEQYAAQAVALDPNSMDVHRVYATVLESLGQYNSAIKEYLQAIAINPNLTFLYVYIGRNYARLASNNPASPLFTTALDYYAKAADINAQLGVTNPIPYIEIAKTYSQMGEFFIASRNAEKALSFDPTNANTYGQLGIIYVRSRNYEGAMEALRCSVRGCAAGENEIAKNLVDQKLLTSSTAVEGLPLTNLTVAYYYVEYGTVLAFLSRPSQNNCPEAIAILEQVSAQYSDDPILTSIVADSEGICARVGTGAPPPEPPAVNPEMTPTPRSSP